MAFSAVVFPAPLGPINPTMRPSSIRKFTPSSATVVPKALCSPRASMHAMGSVLLLSGLRPRSSSEQLFGGKPEPLNGCVHARPFFLQKLLAFSPQQQVACALFHEKAQPAPLLDQFFVDQLLIALQDREGIHAILGGDIAHGRQRIAFLEHVLQYHRDHTVPKLAVNRLAVVPLEIHPVSQFFLCSIYAAVTESVAGPCGRESVCPPA